MARAGARVERTQQLQCLVDVFHGRVEFACESVASDLGQALDRAGCDPQGEFAAGGRGGHGIELQCEAFAEVARAHSGWVEPLQLAQHRQHFAGVGDHVRAQRRGNGLGRFAQVAVVVDGIDQGEADAQLARRQLRQLQLPLQVVVQGFARGHAFGGVLVVAAAAGARTGRGPFLAAFPLDRRFDVVAFVGSILQRLAFVRRGIGRRRRGFRPVQQWVGFHRLGQLGFEFVCGQLQEMQALPQLGREHQLLAERGLQSCLHRGWSSTVFP